MALAYKFHDMTALKEGRAANTPAQAATLLRDSALSGEDGLDMLLTTQLLKKLKF
ncbi:hypothetical protein D3C87_1838980 [compost metagenome]